MSVCEFLYASFTLFVSILSIILTLFNGISRASASETHSQTSLTPNWNTSEISPWWENRLYSIDTTAPVSAFMRESATTEMRASTYALFDLMEVLLDGFVSLRQDNGSSICNLPYFHAWSKAARTRPQVFQLGRLSSRCYSYVHLPSSGLQDAPQFLDDVRSVNIQNVVRDARIVLGNATVNIRFPNDGAWNPNTHPFDGSQRLVARGGQVCEIESASSFIVDSTVYLKAFVSDQEPLSRVRDFGRQNVFEYINRDFSHSLRMIHRRYQAGITPTLQNGSYENCTTVLQLTSGIIVPTMTLTEFEDPFSPVARAYSLAMEANQRARDAVTTSNIAILALPMAMNLIPMAFVADFATIGTLIYVLLTDIISTLPIFLKGIELVLLRRPQNGLTSVYFAGDEKLGVIEIWNAKCQAAFIYGSAGTAFIATATFAMVAGVLLELWALRVMKKRLASGAARFSAGSFWVNGPLGRTGRHSTKFSWFGSASTEERNLAQFEHQNRVLKQLIIKCHRDYNRNLTDHAQCNQNVLQNYLNVSSLREQHQLAWNQTKQQTFTESSSNDNGDRLSPESRADPPPLSVLKLWKSARKWQRRTQPDDGCDNYFFSVNSLLHCSRHELFFVY